MYNREVEAELEAKETAAWLRRIGMSEREVRMGVKANEEERYNVNEHEVYKKKVEKATEKLRRYKLNIQSNSDAFQSFIAEFNQLNVADKPVREKINRLDNLIKDIENLGI